MRFGVLYQTQSLVTLHVLYIKLILIIEQNIVTIFMVEYGLDL